MKRLGHGKYEVVIDRKYVIKFAMRNTMRFEQEHGYSPFQFITPNQASLARIREWYAEDPETRAEIAPDQIVEHGGPPLEMERECSFYDQVKLIVAAIQFSEPDFDEDALHEALEAADDDLSFLEKVASLSQAVMAALAAAMIPKAKKKDLETLEQRLGMYFEAVQGRIDSERAGVTGTPSEEPSDSSESVTTSSGT